MNSPDGTKTNSALSMLILNCGVSVTITIGVFVSSVAVATVFVGPVGVITGVRTGDAEVSIVVRALSV